MTLIFKVTVIVLTMVIVIINELKLLEALLAKITCYHGCGSKISLEQVLDQRQNIGIHFYIMLYYIIENYIVIPSNVQLNFNSREKEEQFYSGIPQE